MAGVHVGYLQYPLRIHPHAEGAAVRVAVAPNALLLFEQGRETDRRTAVPTAKHHH